MSCSGGVGGGGGVLCEAATGLLCKTLGVHYWLQDASESVMGLWGAI